MKGGKTKDGDIDLNCMLYRHVKEIEVITKHASYVHRTLLIANM